MLEGKTYFKKVPEPLRWCVAAVVVCLAILTCVLELWKADLNIPFCYSGDSFVVSMIIKGQNDGAWFIRNDFLGAPFGFNMSDYITFGLIHFCIFKLLSLFSHAHFFILNVYFLLGFPLITIAALYVFRKFHVSYFASMVGGLLYAFLPYHFMRGESHLSLSSYFLFPLMVMVLLWFVLGQLSFVQRQQGMKVLLLNRKAVVSCIICVLIGMADVYCIFFSCFFILIAALYTLFNSRAGIKGLLAAGGLIFIIAISAVINILPNVLYIQKNGYNPYAIDRDYAGAEVYGMKIAQLVLPVSGHRLPLFAELKEKYNQNYPLVNENDSSTLGLVGTAGFLILLMWIFRRKEQERDKGFFETMDALAVFNIFAVLFGTLGGLGAVFSMGFRFIRGYNRISIVIAFFSIFALLLLLENFFKRKKAVYFFVLMAVLALGIYDQTTEYFVPDYQGVAAAYRTDKTFVEKIEAILPAGSMIFQLPYLPFPEHPPIYQMNDYSHFMGYLHSKKLKWSYGVIKGRPGDLWQRILTSFNTADMISALISAGFKGLYVDTFGYPDMGNEMIASISSVVGAPVIASGDNRYYFFRL